MMRESSITLIGILDDGWAGLNDAARQRISAADLIIGAARTLELVRPHAAPGSTLQSMDGALTQVPQWLQAAQTEQRKAVVLATGDPLCHGLATWLRDKARVPFEIMPNLSTLQLACARWQETWDSIAIASCHTRDAGEWAADATPEHGLYPAMRAIARNERVFLFTSAANSPARIARALLTAGYDSDEVTIAVAARLQLPDESIETGLSLDAAAATEFAQPNVMLVTRKDSERRATFGFDDLDFVQRSPDKGLITKQEARAVSLAKLALRADDTVWDIGAGAGSVGLEAARLVPHGHVWAIEKNADDAANARRNAVRLRATNYTLVDGKAPQHLAQWPAPNAVFIGGSGGELDALITLILDRLQPGGRLVMNFVTLENMATAVATLNARNADWDCLQLQANRSQPILDMHRMAAQNPVWIITARKDEH